MKIEVIVIDGIVESVLTDGEADIEIVSIDKDYEDREALEKYADKLYADPQLKERKFINAHFDEDGLPLTVGCENCGEIFELQSEAVYTEDVSGCNIPTAKEPVLKTYVSHVRKCRCPNCDNEIRLDSTMELVKSQDMSHCFHEKADNG